MADTATIDLSQHLSDGTEAYAARFCLHVDMPKLQGLNGLSVQHNDLLCLWLRPSYLLTLQYQFTGDLLGVAQGPDVDVYVKCQSYAGAVKISAPGLMWLVPQPITVGPWLARRPAQVTSCGLPMAGARGTRRSCRAIWEASPAYGAAQAALVERSALQAMVGS